MQNRRRAEFQDLKDGPGEDSVRAAVPLPRAPLYPHLAIRGQCRGSKRRKQLCCVRLPSISILQKEQSHDPGITNVPRAGLPSSSVLQLPTACNHSLSHITGDLSVFLLTFIKALDVSRHLQMLDNVLSPHDRGECYYYSAHL